LHPEVKVQKTYVFTTNVNFSQHDFYVIPGDTGVYDAAKLTLTVYRGGDLVKSFNLPLNSIRSMLDLGWIKEEGTKAVQKNHPQPINESETVISFEEIENIKKCGIDDMAPKLSQADIDKPASETLVAKPQPKKVAAPVAPVKEEIEVQDEVIEFEGDEEEDTVRISIEPEDGVTIKTVETEERFSLDGTPTDPPARKLLKKPGPKPKAKA
jgi:hypothetical protein